MCQAPPTIYPKLLLSGSYVPSTQGRIIHSTTVGGGPCMCRLVRAMCCEASSSRKRKVR